MWLTENDLMPLIEIFAKNQIDPNSIFYLTMDELESMADNDLVLKFKEKIYEFQNKKTQKQKIGMSSHDLLSSHFYILFY